MERDATSSSDVEAVTPTSGTGRGRRDRLRYVVSALTRKGAKPKKEH